MGEQVAVPGASHGHSHPGSSDTESKTHEAECFYSWENEGIPLRLFCASWLFISLKQLQKCLLDSSSLPCFPLIWLLENCSCICCSGLKAWPPAHNTYCDQVVSEIGGLHDPIVFQYKLLISPRTNLPNSAWTKMCNCQKCDRTVKIIWNPCK